MIGETIGHYRILELLGEGGMGVVYRAEDTKLHRTVALKFLPPEALDDQELRTRFFQEARAAAALDHPHVCTVFEIGEEENRLYIAMAHIGGLSLKEKLRSGPLELREAIKLATQIGEALAAAHAKGIVHRDVKCANIMLTEDGQARITDFGLAGILTGERTPRKRKLSGTLAYMSPEQTRGEEIDQRSDIWSWGVCFYEMLTGTLPFRGDYEQAVIYSILNEQPRPASALWSGIPLELDRLLEKALCKNQETRYQTVRELLTDLKGIGDALDSRDTGEGDAAHAGQPSVAVLPFANMSADPEQEYFCDGITADITDNLTYVEGLRVASRTSSFAFKGKHADIRRIGRDLGVETIVEGSVQKFADRLRITAHLTSVRDGYQLWSERYDRKLADVFALQDEISLRIAQALQVKLTEKDREALRKAPTKSIEAYDFYLRGRKFFYQSKRKGIDYAREMFSRAIDRDANYALAYAGMADCHSYLYMYFDHSQDNLDRAMTASNRALELDPESAEAHAARGLAFSLSERYQEAEAEFEQAVDLNPQLFEAHYFYARTCLVQGKMRVAARHFEQACAVYPEGYQAPLLLGQAYRGAGEKAKAEAVYRRALDNIERHVELHPDDSRAIILGSAALIELGDGEKGLDWARRGLAMDPKDPYTVYGVACAFARLNRVEEAITHLGQAIDCGFAHRAWVDNDNDFDLIRDHPSFQALLERLD